MATDFELEPLELAICRGAKRARQSGENDLFFQLIASYQKFMLFLLFGNVHPLSVLTCPLFGVGNSTAARVAIVRRGNAGALQPPCTTFSDSQAKVQGAKGARPYSCRALPSHRLESPGCRS